MKRQFSLGPGFLVTAAFIGPGTVLTASKAGSSFGFALLWAIVFSVVAAIVLQEMTARLGIATGNGLGEAIRKQFQNPLMKFAGIGLTIGAILIGNAAYQTGNLMGAAVGFQLFGDVPQSLSISGFGITAAVLLLTGKFEWIKNALVGLVVAMSVMFLAAAAISRPDFGELLSGCLVPRIPGGDWAGLMVVVSIIGTTVVPYNLFLHASGAAKNWQGVERTTAVWNSRIDTILAVGLGGLVTAAILVSAVPIGNIAPGKGLPEVAGQLKPVLGNAAYSFFMLGLIAAGLTSSITAPLAAGYAVGGCLGWNTDIRGSGVRVVMLCVIAVGVGFAVAMKKSPDQAIIFAQLANGLILPFVGVVLMIVLNSKSMGRFRNGPLANIAGGTILVIVFGLGFRTFTAGLSRISPNQDGDLIRIAIELFGSLPTGFA